MKTSLGIRFMAVLTIGLLSSCVQKEMDMEKDPVSSAVTFRAVYGDNIPVKSIIDDDGIVQWDCSEDISLFYGNSFSAKFSWEGFEPSGTAEFRGVLDDIEDNEEYSFIAVYPYSDENTCDGESVTLALPAAQTAVAGTFADELYIMLARTNNYILTFYHLCGGVRFTVTEANITSVTFKGNGGESLAGTITAGFDTSGRPSVEDVTNTADELTLTAPADETLIPGKWYYIVALPGTLSKGYTLTLHRTDGTAIVKDSDQSVTIKRAIWGQLEKVDASLIPDNEIWYTSDDGNIVNPRYPQNFGANIVSNTYESGSGVIKFDDAITSIGESVFHGCEHLTSITIPGSVTSIGEEAFFRCNGLADITIPNSVTSIGRSAFFHCRNLTRLSIPDSVISIGADAFNECSKLVDINLPDFITSIENSTFSGCGLKNITIPESVTSIGKFAFSKCVSLTKVSMSNSVINIADHAFDGCSKLVDINLSDSITSIENSTFSSCERLRRIIIPDSVASIADEAFSYCTSLNSITIPDSVTSIGEGAFMSCKHLEAFYGKFASEDNRCLIIDRELRAFAPYGSASYVVSDTVTRIGYAAFYSYDLASVIIPDSVTSIGPQAFSFCKVTSITIPASVAKIESQAFYSCQSLKEVYVYSLTPPEMEDNVFSICPALTEIYVPEISLSDYQLALRWKDYASFFRSMMTDETLYKIEYTTNDGKVLEISYDEEEYDEEDIFGANIISNTYENGRGIIKFDEMVICIGDEIFSNCKNLTSMTIPRSVEFIGYGAFRGCTSLVSMYLYPTEPPEIDDEVFSKCPELKSIYVPTKSLFDYTIDWNEYAHLLRAMSAEEELDSDIENMKTEIWD